MLRFLSCDECAICWEFSSYSDQHKKRNANSTDFHEIYVFNSIFVIFQSNIVWLNVKLLSLFLFLKCLFSSFSMNLAYYEFDIIA